MGETKGEIRRDIEQIRVEMADTLDAIGYKMDLMARMRYRLSKVTDSVAHLFGGGDGMDAAATEEVMASPRLSMESVPGWSMMESAGGRISQAVQSTEERLSGMTSSVGNELARIKESVVDTVTSQAESTGEMAKTRSRQVGYKLKDNALLLGIGAFAATLAAGMLLPRTRIEEEKVAPLATNVAHKAVEAGEKALHKGEEMAKDAVKSMAGDAASGEK